MGIQIEKIYYLENPEVGIKQFATETQIRFESIIKDVFGVAFIGDLPMMIHYNKKFQECVSKANNIPENEITLDLVFRLATKNDLIPLRAFYLQQKEIEESQKGEHTVTPPFDHVIQLHEGIFEWCDKDDSYVKVS